MEASVVTAVGTLVLGLLGIQGRLLQLERRAHYVTISKLEGCVEERSDCHERQGALTATVQYLARQHGPEVQTIVKETLDEAEARIEARRAEAEEAKQAGR